MEDYFKENGGAVLSTTFDKYCYVNVRHLPRFFDYSAELSYSRTERVTSIEDIEHPAIRNAMKMLDMHEIRLTYEADLPARSGLGTSSSFAVGMLNAFMHWRVSMLTRRNLLMKPFILKEFCVMKPVDGRIRLPHLMVGSIELISMWMVMRCCLSLFRLNVKSSLTTI